MIHTEHGRLLELIAFMKQDREYVREALGVGPSGSRSRDKTLTNNSVRYQKFFRRERNLTAVINVLQALLK